MNFKDIFEKRIGKMAIIVILAVLILAGFLYRILFIKTYESKEFIGPVEAVEGKYILSTGVFTVIDHPEFYEPDKRKTVKIEITSNTEIIKILMHMPTLEDLEKTDGRWNPNEFWQEEKPGSIEDIKKGNGMMLKVSTKNNIFNKSKFQAQKIEYIEQVYSD